jgi:hypothetical protein
LEGGDTEPNFLLQPLRPTNESEPITRTGRTAERGVSPLLVKTDVLIL